jgi:hypothetical protein
VLDEPLDFQSGLAAAIMLGSATATTAIDNGTPGATHLDIADVHVSLLGHRTWRRLHERPRVHGDYDILEVPAVYVHVQSSAAGPGLVVRVGVPQVSLDWRLEWHLAIVALVQTCTTIVLKAAAKSSVLLTSVASGTAVSTVPPSSSSDLKQLAKEPSAIKMIEVEAEHITISFAPSPASVLNGDLRLLQLSLDRTGKKGSVVHLGVQSTTLMLNDHRIGVVQDLQINNSIKSSEASKYTQGFNDSSNPAYAPLEGGSKTFWWVLGVAHIDIFTDHIIAGS